jgi:hypothetical protein
MTLYGLHECLSCHWISKGFIQILLEYQVMKISQYVVIAAMASVPQVLPVPCEIHAGKLQRFQGALAWGLAPIGQCVALTSIVKEAAQQEICNTATLSYTPVA